ncbi:TPA: hypothetical protein N0F65_007363 [Lagenidium giganteum]|uniref:Uncharacterized protein n=1 Tax=Lagenidium giganteum TaxID=4803 RepID=A0AAV2YGD4_9STRA|nr:TPA: hypothetical protein N0F65_007363 [Lagenidium giganteum]
MLDLVLMLALLPWCLVRAHGIITVPKADYKNWSEATFYNLRIDASVDPVFSGRDWNTTEIDNAKLFNKLFPQTKYKTLKEFIDTFTDCGNSREDIPPVDVSHYNNMTFQNDQEKKGLIDSHHGPCEIWIGRHRLLREDDCCAKYTDYPAVMPVDYSVCKGKCMLKFYWLALHDPAWQLYQQCVPIYNFANGAVSASVDSSASGSLDVGSFPPTTPNSDASGSKPTGNSIAPKTSSSSKGFNKLYLIPIVLVPVLVVAVLVYRRCVRQREENKKRINEVFLSLD